MRVDALELLKMHWDMIIAFPPCTYLSNAGARHLFRGGELNRERYAKGLEAKAFFLNFYNADCPKIAVENPVSSRIYEMPPHTQEIQPWQFGHPVQKKTRLWLKGLPLLEPTNVVEYKLSLIHISQSRQCMEEAAELIQAINKRWRKAAYGETIRRLQRQRNA